MSDPDIPPEPPRADEELLFRGFAEDGTRFEVYASGAALEEFKAGKPYLAGYGDYELVAQPDGTTFRRIRFGRPDEAA
jgi:hypothetical protein